MPLDKEWLDILVCPETKQRLKEADPALIERVNRQIAAGTLVNVGGEKVTTPIQTGLLREDGQVLYIVQDDIPNMLKDDAIRVDRLKKG